MGLALFAFLAGCQGTTIVDYEPYPVYPPRTDVIVIANPPSMPTSIAPTGQLDAWLKEHAGRGGQIVDPADLTPDQRGALAKALEELFGSPAQPRVNLDRPEITLLGLSPEELTEGNRLYRRHCANCHGLTGDGRGPTGGWVYPYPRDGRLGKFKFVSTSDGSGTATRADLNAAIRNGVPGTSMPPFNLANDVDTDRMTSAVIYLSLRGEVELKLIRAALDPQGDGLPADVSSEARRLLAAALERWASAQPLTVPTQAPPADEASIRRGHELFVSVKTGCLACHEDYGRKDTYRYDAWGTPARVANLTERDFRGGGEPADLFKRIRGGIPTVGMPAQMMLTDAEVWDLVHFIRAVKVPTRLPEDVRRIIYPEAAK